MSSSLAHQYLEPGDPGVGPNWETVAPKRLKDIYDDYFQIVPAETEEQRKLAFRLRYQSYCVEHAYENPAQNPCEMETDVFDAVSLHALLMHRPSGSPVGAVRLILPHQDGCEVILPIRNVCRHESIVRDSAGLPRAQTAEISRFVISKSFRRRAHEETSVGTFAMPGKDPRRIIPNTSLGLMQAIVAMAAQAGVSHLCAVMESTLLRVLCRFGIHFHNLGPAADYHGRRQPCYSDIDELLTRIWLERPDIWELVTDDGNLWPLNTSLGCVATALSSWARNESAS